MWNNSQTMVKIKQNKAELGQGQCNTQRDGVYAHVLRQLWNLNSAIYIYTSVRLDISQLTK